MAWRRLLLLGALLSSAAVGAASPVWAVDPRHTGPDLPPVGRSLFDHLVAAEGRYDVPFPFTALVARIEQQLARDAYLDQPLKTVMIPLGRSLQRAAAAPDFFASPRVVVVADAEPAWHEGESGMQLGDRLYIGYLEAADVLEVISYNEVAGRFEFQVVRDYRAGGRAEVHYAPRALCLACHQNAAPIFARPLWDETNANPAVAKRLAEHRPQFYGYDAAQGIDVAYAVDNATDRANQLALTQLLWQKGCGGADDGGRRCRGALLLRALQSALSGRHRFDTAQTEYTQALSEPMQQVRRRLWPDGLLEASADIPNRRPMFADGRPAAAGNDIPAADEPLAPRAPAGHWNPAPDLWVARAVNGITAFIAQPDLDRLDSWLTNRPVTTDSTRAGCKDDVSPFGEGSRIKFECVGENLRLRGRLYHHADGSLRGRIDSLRIDDDELGVLQLVSEISSPVSGASPRLRPGRIGSDRTVRLADGRALQQIVFAGGDRVTGVEVVMRDEFDAVAAAVRRLVDGTDEALAPVPFSRAAVLGVLFDELGMPAVTWCCDAHDHLPPAILETGGGDAEAPELAPFYQFCARCHGTDSPFPPNFLAGGVEEVRQRVAHCAPRIRYRLGMWELPAAQRPKTPMPPEHALAAPESGVPHWRGGQTLLDLRAALAGVMGAEGVASPSIDELLSREYAGLPECLPKT